MNASEVRTKFLGKILRTPDGHWFWPNEGADRLRIAGIAGAREIAWYMVKGEWWVRLKPTCGSRECIAPDHQVSEPCNPNGKIAIYERCGFNKTAADFQDEKPLDDVGAFGAT